MTLALFVLGDMSEQTLPLRIYTTEDAAAEYEANYLSAALKSYAGTIDEHISRITGLASAAPPIDIPPTIDVPSTPNRSPYPSVVDGHGALSVRMDDSPSIPPYRDLPSRQSQSRTLKRSRSGKPFNRNSRPMRIRRDRQRCEDTGWAASRADQAGRPGTLTRRRRMRGC